MASTTCPTCHRPMSDLITMTRCPAGHAKVPKPFCGARRPAAPSSVRPPGGRV